MELRDFIVTPIVIVMVYGIAYFVRSRVTDEVNRKYFIPALTVRIIGALALGILYQFYYDGGDTFNFHTGGSRHVWEAFMDSPFKGVRLLFTDGSQTGIYEYSSRIEFFKDPPTYFVIRIAAFFDLFTFSSYSATAVLFSVTSFIGSWMMFTTFYKRYPNLARWLAVTLLYIPSVVFWGSGLLKDTITLACLGAATFGFDKIFLQKKITPGSVLILTLSLFVIFNVKKFILQAYIPSVIIWILAYQLRKVKSVAVKTIVFPVIVIIMIASAYYSVVKVGEGDTKYSVNQLVKTAQITAYDIRFITGKNAGSGYTLGELGEDWQDLVKLAPGAINVSLFRPYLWEVKNPLMLMSALEGLILFLFTLYVIFKKKLAILPALKNPDIMFMLAFSIIFAFAVGVSTFNFGTLSRYKIPILPFYSTAMVLLLNFKSDLRLE